MNLMLFVNVSYVYVYYSWWGEWGVYKGCCWYGHCFWMSPMSMCITVGEEDEVSIKDAADMVIEAMDFKGEVVVSFSNKAVRMVHFQLLLLIL